MKEVSIFERYLTNASDDSNKPQKKLCNIKMW
jgi:hypothetical protein